MQQCRRCKQVKPSEAFYNTKRTVSGLYERCKICCKIQNEENKEARKRYAKTVKGRSARRKYHQSESYDVIQKIYHGSAKGRASLRSNCAKRKKKIKQATPKWVDQSAITSVYVKAAQLEKQTGIKYNVDHIIPLINEEVCGLNVPWNLQILSETDNKIKGNSFDGTYENDSWRMKYGISA